MATITEKEKEIESVLEKIRPALAIDEGNIVLNRVEDDIVYLELVGTCAHCPISDMTMKDTVVLAIKQLVPWAKTVMIGQSKFSYKNR
jgi:Fe-S cluster biogenesis protein NfuA